MYRLTPPPSREGGGEAQPRFQLTHGDRHLLLGYSLGPHAENLGIRPADGGYTIRPRNLEPSRRYRLQELSPEGEVPAIVRTGSEWMAEGLPVIRTSSYAGILAPA
jgi:hypothetical protein